MKIIVTDLTRFGNKDIVCTAGIDIETGRCIRPMPYLKMSECKRLNILPGSVLEGKFTSSKALAKPHLEDMDYSSLSYLGPCTPEQFLTILENSTCDSVQSGFEIELQERQKHIPTIQAPDVSIITIKVNPTNLEIVPNEYKPGELKIIFTDSDGFQFRYLSITDLGFYQYATKTACKPNGLNTINSFIHNQAAVYLRIGLGRNYKIGDKEGYWIQVNGIYTFPDYLKEIRSY